jgi:putative transposase
MSTSTFTEGTVVEIDNRLYKLLRKIDADTWQAEESRAKRISEFTALALRTLYAEGQLTFYCEQATAQLPPQRNALADFRPEQWDMAKTRRAYVTAVLDLPATESRIVRVIQEVWEKIRQPFKAPNPVTVLRWKKKYTQAGRDIRSLIDRSDRKGNKSKRYADETEAFVTQAIDSVYLKVERGTIQATLDRASALINRENKLRPEAIQLQLPTRRLVKRLINALPAYDRYAARHGRVAATRHFRTVIAHRTTEAPLERAEMDHTQLDKMVIDDDTGMPLGRPWLTGCLDDYTRNALGIHVSFEPPSHFTVARCLKHAFLPKVRLRQDYPAIKNDWMAHGVMRELVIDNGAEFHSESLENACYSLGIELHYSARKTPWFKGKIERWNGTVNRETAHGTPGTTFQNIFEKSEYDPVKHAVIRYSVFKEIIHTWVADVYHQRPHRTLKIPPALMWERSISQDAIPVPDDLAKLDAILGRNEVRRLTHKGIELYGLLYNSPELTTLRRNLGDKLEVEIRVDAADIGKIIVLSPDKRQMFTVHSLSPKYAAGLSEWQHRVCKRYAAVQNKFEAEGWLEAKLRIAELIQNEVLHKKQRTRSKVARYNENAKSVVSVEPTTPQINDIATSVRQVAKQPREPVNAPAAANPVDGPQFAEAPKKMFKPVLRDRNHRFIETEDVSDA